jgi:hypothetical protein
MLGSMKMRFALLALAIVAVAVSGGCQQTVSMEQRPIEIAVTVPDPAWTVTIEEVYASSDRLIVVSRLQRDPETMAPQVISRATDRVKIAAPDLPVEHFVLGKTFGWAEEPHRFIRDRRELDEVLKNARRLYPRPGP